MSDETPDTTGLREAVIDAKHLTAQRAWSLHTFGPGSRLKGVLAHIRKELKEIEADPTDVTEWVDVIILAFDGAWRAGWEPQQIIDAIKAKQARNEARKWPDWRTASQDDAIEHIAEGAAHPTPDASPDPTPGAGCHRGYPWCDGKRPCACPCHDPAVVTPDAGDVEALVCTCGPFAPYSSHEWDCPMNPQNDPRLDPDWLANHVAAAREADRAEVERLRAERDCYHARADVLRAKLSGGVALRGGKPGDYWAEWHRTHCAAAQGAAEERARAEAAEERLAGLVAKIEALADEWGIDLHAGSTITSGDDFAEAIGDNGAWRFARDLRALLPADAATALDAVREKAKAEERERIAQSIEAMGNVCISAHGDRCVGGIAYRDAARIARHTPEATS